VGLTQEAIAIRLALTTRSIPPRSPIDSNTGFAPKFWRGEDIEFQVGVFDAQGDPIDLSNLAFLEIDFFPISKAPTQYETNLTYNPFSTIPYPSTPPVPLLTKTLEAEEIQAEMSREQWMNGTAAQAVFTFSPEETASLQLQGANSRKFWMAIHGLTQSGRKLTYIGGDVEVFESGVQGLFLPNLIAPQNVPLKTSFFVQENQQLLYSIPIEVTGDLIVDGYLIEVAPEPGLPITDNDGNEITDNDGNVITA
jgi:hypothetical protein